MVRFEQVDADELARRLVDDSGVSADEAAFLATYSQGRPGIAIGLIGDDEFRRKREAVARIASVASSGKPWAALALAEALRSGVAADEGSDDEEAESPPAAKGAAARSGARQAASEALDMLLIWYRDLTATKLQGENAAVVNSDMRKQLLEQSAHYRHAGPLLAGVEAILRAKRRIQGNAVPQIVTEALMVRLRRLEVRG